MGWNISSTHGCFCRAYVRQGLDSFCQCIQKKSIIPRRQARAVAPVVPRRSVRDCYREPDQPASREVRRRAAVKPRPACFPSSTLRGCAAQSGVKGYYPLREPWHLSCHGGLCAIVTGNPTKPVSREARCRAAVKPRPACFPSSTLRGCVAQSGVKGGERKRVPSGHNRRRRLATGSRQPKRGFGTAVPKTTIEVADHYPLLSRRWPARRRCTRRKPSDRNRRPLPYRSPC